jgi:hypothetical protein
MKRPIDKILRFWVDSEYHVTRGANVGCTRSQQIANILWEFEKAGDAMRYVAPNGRIAWKATPNMMTRLADAEREVKDDLEDEH